MCQSSDAAATTVGALSIHLIADTSAIGPLHKWFAVLCSFILRLDGHDLTVIGVTPPSPMASLKSCTALLGTMVDAVMLRTLANRIGRVRTLAISIFASSVVMGACGLPTDVWPFRIVRFIAGLGAGGMAPARTVSVAEFVSRRFRSLFTTSVFSPYSIGGVLASRPNRSLLNLGCPTTE